MWPSIKKFGLNYCDLPTMLSNVSAMLTMLGLNIDGRNKTGIPLVYLIITGISSAVYIYSYIFSGTWFIFWRSRELGDLSGAFVEFSLNATSAIAFIKLVYMMFQEERFKRLTKKYLECDARIVSGSRFSFNMLMNLRNVKRRGIIFWLILMVDAVVYTVKPFGTPGRHLTMDSFVIYGLEPMLESPNFEIATVVMTISITFICYVVANIGCFLILLTGYIETQMLSLSGEMRHLWEDAIHNYKELANLAGDKIAYENLTELNVVNDYIKEHLIDIAKRHAMNINNLKEIEDAMTVPNAIGFLLLVMGLIAELLGGLETTYLQLPYTMLQLSVDCYLGQKVMDANEEFAKAVYDCKWEMFDKNNRKLVLVILQNAQKTMKMTAGGMATLSFVSLMSIIKSTYSAYTTLRSMI